MSIKIKRAPLTIEDINIGDSVLFEAPQIIYNEDITWKVIAKLNGMIRIKAEMGNTEPVYLDLCYVLRCESYD